MRVTVTIVRKEVATFEAGDIPADLIRDVLEDNDGSFDGGWVLSDVARDSVFTVELVEVVEAGKAASDG